MSVGLQISVKGQRIFVEAAKAIDPKIIMPLVGLRWFRWIMQNFKDQGAEGRWRPLAPSTVMLRRRGGSVPLQDTGGLRQSFGQTVLGLTSVWVGTKSKIAQWHEDGTAPYTIRPKSAKVLAASLGGGTGRVAVLGGSGGQGGSRTFGAKGGRFIFFGKEVHHPGIPQRHMLPSKSLAEQLATQVIEATLTEAIVRGSN